MKSDIAIIGAGPAGVTAAIDLVMKGVRVTLIDEVESCERDITAGWLPADATGLLRELGVSSECIGEPFEEAVFISADASKSTATTSHQPPASRTCYGTLIDALHRRAGALNVERITGRGKPVVSEDRVLVELQDDQVEARLMIDARGAACSAGSLENATVAALTCAIESSKRSNAIHWMIGLDAPRMLAAWWTAGDDLVVTMHFRGGQVDPEGMIMPWARQILTTMDLSPDAIRSGPHLRAEPFHRALDIESHVGKRCLLVGDAGGFVATPSHQSLYPAIWSARLAAGVVADALGSRRPQDAMRRFDTLWRSEMADYLRPPNTDARFLVPLIFSNEQMAAKMADAFWNGTNI